MQTNFSVVAYTRSELHIAMLSLFVDIRCRLPNAVMGHITRDVVKRSFRKRIGARAIQTFLESHAHARVRERRLAEPGRRLVPENVVDQLFLWEQEENRATFEKGALLRIADARAFDSALGFARAHGYCLWHSRENRSLVVAEHAEEVVSRRLRRQRERMAARGAS